MIRNVPILLVLTLFFVTVSNSSLCNQKEQDMELPDFWRGRVEDIRESVQKVSKGEVEVIARSPGGRDVYLVKYGERDDFAAQANYNSACGARNPGFYARKTEKTTSHR